MISGRPFESAFPTQAELAGFQAAAYTLLSRTRDSIGCVLLILFDRRMNDAKKLSGFRGEKNAMSFKISARLLTKWRDN